jgi:hypothetical protein
MKNREEYSAKNSDRDSHFFLNGAPIKSASPGPREYGPAVVSAIAVAERPVEVSVPDDKLHEFYARAARTLSIALEVYQDIKRGDERTAANAVTRLELELAGWQPEIDAHAAYQLATEEFGAARAVWQHVKIGTKPDTPPWPAVLPPQSGEIDMTIGALRGFKFNVAQLQESIECAWSLERDVPAMATSLKVMSGVLDRMMKQLDEKPVTKDAVPIPPPPGQVAQLIGQTVFISSNKMDAAKADGSPLHCVMCGKELQGPDRDRSSCHECRSPFGKVADLAVAIEASGDSPERIREWPAIRHLLRDRFGNSLGEEELWLRCKDQLAAHGIMPSEYLAWKLTQLMDYLRRC